MKKQWKILTGAVVFLIPVSLVVVFSLPLSKKKQISCVGSSGVKPFIENLANHFAKTNQNYDVTVDAGGSGYGISQVANNYTSIGNASKNPFSAVKEQYQDLWVSNQIKTITVGWEAICMVYIPPKGLSTEATNNLNTILAINDSNIINLYRSFSGYSDGLANSVPYLGDFINDQSTALNENDKSILKSTQLLPYARSGGSTTSGTAASFYDNSHFNVDYSQLSIRQQNAFIGGKYGDDFRLIDTDEANSRAWDYFSRNNIAGSCVYLSSGFVSQNIDLITKDGYGIFAYNNVAFDVKNIENGYNFYRPLNIMTSLSNHSAWDFVNYLLQTDETDWEPLGAKKISDQDLQTMEVDGNIQIDDYDLMIHRGQDWSDENVTFGVDENA